jgi:ADP-heptose:LPS heptosyltransferase
MEVTTRIVQVTRRAEEVRTPGETIPGIRRLLVVRDDRLGDLLLTLPAIDALRRTYPDAEFGLVVAAAHGEVCELLACVDRIFPVERGSGPMLAAIRAFDPQLLVSISRGPQTAVAAARVGTPHRIGTGYRYFSPLFTRRVNERRRLGERHELEYALSFAHRAGARAGVARFPIEIAPPTLERVAQWLVAAQLTEAFVVVHPGTGGSCPVWPIRHYVELVSRLRERGVGVVVTVGPDDDSVAAAFEHGSPAARETPRFRHSSAMLGGLTGRAALVVSNSTAPVHLAAAQGTPTLALHAPWPSCGATRWGPYGTNGWVLEADAAGAARWNRRERLQRAAALMAGIPPEQVLRHVISLLETGLACEDQPFQTG